MLASYSCVQDATEDLQPVVSGSSNGSSGEVKTLQVALPTPTRTELGDKVDGKYPVFWSEGDVLAVNGKPTTNIAINSENPSVAVFDLPLDVSVPYNILYPYTGEVVNSEGGMYPVRFTSEQLHTVKENGETTFALGSAPMYTWSDGFSDIEMHHLSTVLRFSIKAAAGEEVELRYVSVSTTGAEPISGVFDVYCGSRDEEDSEAGKLVAREGATSTVFYSFGKDEYYSLDSEKESVFYITVPKGSYSGFEVNFVDKNGGVCVKTFEGSGDYELIGGKVREFPTVEYVVNSTMRLVGTDADMLDFANQVKNGTFAENFNGVLLIGDVEMAGVEWTPVENYNLVFEGRNHSIKHLSAPLFGEKIGAKISNVVVDNRASEDGTIGAVTIEETTLGRVGIIARSLASTGEVFNCSAYGNIVYNNSKLDVNEDLDLINVGGVVGCLYGGSIKKTDSHVNIVIQNSAKSGEAGSYQPCVGGVVGYVCADSDVAPVVSDNVSDGSIDWDDQSKATRVIPFIGGVAGYVTAGTFENNVNSGQLSISEEMYDLDWGGVIGASSVTVANCKNEGDMTIRQTVTKANIAGVIGKLEAASLTGCENKGRLLLDRGFVIKSSCNIGGVISVAEEGTNEILNCTNSGSIKYNGECLNPGGVNSSTGNGSIRIGGVIGIASSKLIKECSNAKSGSVIVGGVISGNYDSVSDKSSIAGVVATRMGKSGDETSPVTIESCSNAGDVECSFVYAGGIEHYDAAKTFVDGTVLSVAACIGMFDSDRAYKCTNDGAISMALSLSTETDSANATTRLNCLNLSGLIGTINSDCSTTSTDLEDYNICRCVNNGVVSCDNSEARIMNIAGVVAQFANGVNCKIAYCSNANSVYVGKNIGSNTVSLKVAGLIASTYQTNAKVVYTDCSNAGSVESAANINVETYLGGVIGYAREMNKSGVNVNNIENTGTVKFSGSSSKVYMGGFAGLYYDTVHTVTFANRGSASVIFTSDGVAKETLLIGGVVGCAAKQHPSASSTYIRPGTLKMKNEGAVTVDGYADKIFAGGLFGFLEVSRGAVECEDGISNSGRVSVSHDSHAVAYPTEIYMGGVLGYIKSNALYDTSNTTSVYGIKGYQNSGSIIYKGIAADGAYVGGVVGKSQQAILENCSNYGNIESSGNAGSLPARYGQYKEKSMSMQATQLHYHDLAIGGVVGETDNDVINCVNGSESNTSTIKHTCTVNPLKRDEWGEDASSRIDIGGLVGRTYVAPTTNSTYTLYVSNSHNYAKVIIDGEYPYCTTNTSSIDLGDDTKGTFNSNDIDDYDRTDNRVFYRMNMAGLVGRLHDHSNARTSGNYMTQRIENCVNHGDVTLADARKAKVFNLAGAVGDVLSSHTEISNTSNFGNIAINNAGTGTSTADTGRHQSFLLNMGGMVAMCFDYRFRSGNRNGSVYHETLSFDGCRNEGNLSLKEAGASFFHNAGGMLGFALHALIPYRWSTTASHQVDTSGGANKFLWNVNYTTGHYTDMTVNMTNCVNTGNISYYSDVVNDMKGFNYSYGGGMLGASGNTRGTAYQIYSAVDVNMTNCTNEGEIQFERSNGRRSSNTSHVYSAVGGMVGLYTGGFGLESLTHYNGISALTGAKKLPEAYKLNITSCTNKGRIASLSGMAGGIIGMGFWYVNITGTAGTPTINRGDIVVSRNESNAVRVNQYYTGGKIVYAGGIAGSLAEYGEINDNLTIIDPSDTMELGSTSYIPDCYLGTNHVRVEYAVNEGTVGAISGFAGGIAGHYRSFRTESDAMYSDGRHKGGIENCANTGEIYSLEGTTTRVGAIVGTARMFSMQAAASNASTEGLSLQEHPCQVGVYNCAIGGSILRAGSTLTKVSKSNYYNYIYGENWSNDFKSVVDKNYDGCTLYSASAASANTTVRR